MKSVNCQTNQSNHPDPRPTPLGGAGVILASAAALGFLVAGASAQITFSVDFQAVPKGLPSFFPGVPISEGDILVPPFGMPAPGPMPAPGIVTRPGPAPGPVLPNLGLLPFPAGPIAPGMPRLVEVDALSYGTDMLLTPMPFPNRVWTFSVDEFAAGLPVAGPPNVFTEGVFGAMEASADVYMSFPPGVLPPLPMPPAPGPSGNTMLFDGNGVPAPFVFPIPPIPGLLGLGLMEVNPPTPMAMPDPGSNLDAIDIDTPPGTFPVYFSLDAMFIDPLEGPPANSGSAAAHATLPGNVLVTMLPGAVPMLYAPAPLLGLDLIGGPGSDDLDALVLLENGIPGFQVSTAPFSWVPAGGTDQLCFSVRRGSMVIGAPDSMFGFPICEGDILIPPIVGGVSPFPAIFVAAESLGLATMRMTPGMVMFPPFSDDLDALDVSADCNMNNIPDNYDILWGMGTDCNANGILDLCEAFSDCNCNGIADTCDIASGVLVDTDGDGIPNKCECTADVSGPGGTPNGFVNVDDLLTVIASWGACSGCPADVSPPTCGNGFVNVDDLLAIIAGWGPCP